MIETSQSYFRKANNYLMSRQAPLIDLENDETIKLFEGYKQKTEELFQKGKLSQLRKMMLGFTKDIVKAGDLSFSRYIKATTGYDFEVDNVLEKKLDAVLKRRKIRNRDEYYSMLELRGEFRQFYPDEHEKMEELDKLLMAYKDVPPEVPTHYYKEISMSFSPDGICKLTVLESGSSKDRGYTQVKLDFGRHSCSSVYVVHAIGLDIRAYWVNNNAIVIETKKDYVSNRKQDQVQSFSDVIQVEYVES